MSNLGLWHRDLRIFRFRDQTDETIFRRLRIDVTLVDVNIYVVTCDEKLSKMIKSKGMFEERLILNGLIIRYK